MDSRILRVIEHPKTLGQQSVSTNYSVSKQESSHGQNGSMKPRVVVSEKGLNFIQDQKEFSEKKKADSERTATILRTPQLNQLSIPDQALFFRRSSIGPYSALSRTALIAADSLEIPTPKAGPQTPRLQPVKAQPLSPGLPRHPNFPQQVPHSLEDLPQLSALHTDQNMSSPRAAFRIRTHSNSLDTIKAKAPDAVRQRLISLFQSKKSTNEDPRDTSLRKMKSALADTLSREQTAEYPSAYITKRALRLSEFVRKEEKVFAIKQKLQQVLSGESQASIALARRANTLLAVKSPAQSRICMKEQIEIQKIQKLQVLRSLKSSSHKEGLSGLFLARQDSDSSKQTRLQQRSADEISIEFSNLLQGVEILSTRPKPGHALLSLQPTSRVVFSPELQAKSSAGLPLTRGYFGGVFSNRCESEAAD